VRRGFVENGSMVENIDDFFLDDFLEVGEIDDHSKFDIAAIGNRDSDYGYR
jgi:hypothetical protein